MSNLVQYECKDCKSSWAACGSSVCYNCLSENIFILWHPGNKPERYQLKVKSNKLKLETL